MKQAQAFFLKHTDYQTHQIADFKKIALGLSNRTYYVKTTDGCEFQVRMTENNHLISRQCELVIIRVLGLDFIYYDEVDGNSIRTWIRGHNPTQADIDHNFLDRLVLAIQPIHATDLALLEDKIPLHNDFHFFSIPEVLKLKQEFLDLYTALSHKYAHLPKCLSHNDLSLLNVIWDKQNQQLQIIDFEWARINNPYWDYANFLREAKIDPQYWLYLAKIANLDYPTLVDHLFLTTCFALQWTYCMPVSSEILVYRAEVLEWTQYYYDLINAATLGL